ncbi:Glutaredoxin domain-containing cysteine-rich protein [Actinidia chinensis var. chinensis]|uniref:Glutaredoxin domain-containing cysteine-rich protein n=1 Tax=Actinidia chinensis var. chinensis TaxID=1590841 RepID=A0A2R6R4G1_ACTCC|nr:Glutaredoxin domain-containing cysteine-rich protein [Actinidia chinensis var. chinensis]
MLTLSLASSSTIRALKAITEAKRKKFALPCSVCKGKGFYICKLCKGNSTIEWSPLYDFVFINPCVCPACEGNRVQRCLNCLGKGYY